MSPPKRCLLAAFLLVPTLAAIARAGMPAPLPTNVEEVLVPTDSAQSRWHAISFFLLGLGLSALAVQALWNYLRRDFPWLPRLSFGKALAAVVLWGLVFVIVLSMISGARELMTPGAWQKQGFTYRLAGTEPAAAPVVAEVRRQQMERLRAALLHFAATHNGRFPSRAEADGLGPDLWDVADAPGLRFLYVPGRAATERTTLLAYEPEIDSERRWVLKTDGTLLSLRTGEIQALLGASAERTPKPATPAGGPPQERTSHDRQPGRHP
jgi:hypothetical protein